MVTEAYERLGKRLAEHQRSTQRAVGTRWSGLELVLFPAWDEQWGRMLVLSVRAGFTLPLDVCRELATAVLGKRWIGAGGFEQRPTAGERGLDTRAIAFGVALDAVIVPPRGRPTLEFLRRQYTTWIRWYEPRQLAQGLGDIDSGTLTFFGRALAAPT